MHTRSTRGVSSQNGWCCTAVLGSDQLQLIKCEGRGERAREREIREQKEEGEERSGQPVETRSHPDRLTRSVTVKPVLFKTHNTRGGNFRVWRSSEGARAVCTSPREGRSAPGSWPCWRGMGGTMPAARGEASR